MGQTVSLLIVTFATGILVLLGAGCSSPSAGVDYLRSSMEVQAKSEDWQQRMAIADQLGTRHDHDSFVILLQLLADNHPNVRYAAAKSIEARKDVAFTDELIATIDGLQQDHRWPAYRALRNYPTVHTLNFLASMLQGEISFYADKNFFNEQNSYYLAGSIRVVLQPYARGMEVPPVPVAGSTGDYASFLKSVNQIMGVSHS
jgi:hypothetical protein